jgi:hypothetical protein
VAIDEQLSRNSRLSCSRALITPTSFVNHDEWGDPKADPRQLVGRYGPVPAARDRLEPPYRGDRPATSIWCAM